jgi:hypothetical protein
MNKSRFTEQQIIHAMMRLEVGETPKQLVRKLGISEPNPLHLKIGRINATSVYIKKTKSPQGRLLGLFDGNLLSACLKFIESS